METDIKQLKTLIKKMKKYIDNGGMWDYDKEFKLFIELVDYHSELVQRKIEKDTRF